MDGDAEAVTDGVTDGAEHVGEICAPDGAPPSGSADSVEGCGVQLSTGLQLADPGEEAEDGTGMGVGMGVGVGMGFATFNFTLTNEHYAPPTPPSRNFSE